MNNMVLLIARENLKVNSFSNNEEILRLLELVDLICLF